MRTAFSCLLIDNDEEDQEIFDMALRELNGPACTFYSDSAAAVDRLQTDLAWNPDFIFIDRNMPRLSGLECVAAIRDLERLSGARIYLYSTLAEPTAVAEALRLGATGYLAKPVHFDALVEELRLIFQTNAPTHAC